MPSKRTYLSHLITVSGPTPGSRAKCGPCQALKTRDRLLCCAFKNQQAERCRWSPPPPPPGNDGPRGAGTASLLKGQAPSLQYSSEAICSTLGAAVLGTWQTAFPTEHRQKPSQTTGPGADSNRRLHEDCGLGVSTQIYLSGSE